MNNPKPDDIRPGDVITASWLNDAKNAGVHQVRFGGGMVGRLVGGKLVVTKASDTKPMTPLAFCPWLVKAVAGDYLTCQMDGTGISTPDQVRIAKPPALRSGAQTWTTRPNYVVDSTVIWAAPVGDTGLVDANNVPITLMDINIEGRRSDEFWAKVTAGTLGSNNQATYDVTEQRRTSTGWEDMPNGRSIEGLVYNAREANNTASGLQGNGVDNSTQIFTDNSNLALKEIRGEPNVWIRLDTLADGTQAWTMEASNAIDGTCG